MGRARAWTWGVVLATVALAATAVVDRAFARLYLAEGRARAEATLALTADGLEGHIRRFEAIPALLARDEELRRLVLAALAPGGEAAAQAASEWLAARNAIVGADEIYAIGLDGTTVAASNWAAPDSFVGQNFAYRPYFTEARTGRSGRFYAIGTTSGRRGYYVAVPILLAGRPAGVLALKIDLEAVEDQWRRGTDRILVTDPEGIVFLSAEPAWLYGALGGLSPERLGRTASMRRYADRVPRELTVSRGPGALVSLPDGAGEPVEHVEAVRAMQRAGWTLRVVLPAAPLRAQARVASAAVLLCLFALALAGLLVRQRLLRARERTAIHAAAQAELERRVEARTADLARANALIAAEVAERRATEAELRRTQGDLVQAGKLAALGRISAALSHEINQPLAAARNYADSAAILIDRGETARARETVGQILLIVDRMAAIARHLREVARQPQAPLSDVDLATAVREALAVAGPRLATAGAAVTVDVPDGLAVRAGPVRLQQVLVNLLSNAADAVEGRERRSVRIAAAPEGGRVRLTVADSGPGVPDAIADRIFDPFFTTKGVGAGLGLGLSISFNIVRDFGGTLQVLREAGGGALLAVILDPAPAVRLAAE